MVLWLKIFKPFRFQKTSTSPGFQKEEIVLTSHVIVENLKGYLLSQQEYFFTG
jgi:hypothetical protein